MRKVWWMLGALMIVGLVMGGKELIKGDCKGIYNCCILEDKHHNCIETDGEEYNLEQNLFALQEEQRDGRKRPGEYHGVTIHDPKK